jgi:hypothetical protein
MPSRHAIDELSRTPTTAVLSALIASSGGAYGCLLGVFLLGTLTRYATQWGPAISIVCGFALNLWLRQGEFLVHLGPITIRHIAFTWFVLIGAAATFIIGSFTSFMLSQPWVPGSAVLVETLLDRGADADVAEAEAAIERLAVAPADEGLVIREIWLLRLRALLARAHGDDTAYRDFRDRYRDMAKTLGYEGHIAWTEAML